MEGGLDLHCYTCSALSKVTLQNYGELLPSGSAGTHGYQFQFPEGSPKHTPQDYVLRNAPGSAPKISAGNFSEPFL